MKPKSSAHYQREFRKRLREQGLIKKEVWIRPENSKTLSILEKQLRLHQGHLTIKEGVSMMDADKTWTTETLFRELQESDLFKNGQSSAELIDGVEAALHIVMHEFGDLPIFLTVSGEQIIAESVLWSTAAVNDVNRFNKAILRTHKYFPLSTISLDIIGDGQDYYHMFGALSSISTLPNVIFEIETLASNVIQATEAYSEFLNIAIEA
ncbi:MAG: biofilm formation regulator BacA [Cellvibrionaceae bacterium]